MLFQSWGICGFQGPPGLLRSLCIIAIFASLRDARAAWRRSLPVIFSLVTDPAIIARVLAKGLSAVGLIGLGWGIGGVLTLLLFAVYRLSPMAMELTQQPLSSLHWLALVFSVGYMAYAEGYRGFHKSFAPRVIARARYLERHVSLDKVFLAPLFCMGYIHATRKRKILSFSLTFMIVCFVVLVRMLPQPWRGIVDAGVVTGLAIGIASILYYLVQSFFRPELLTVSPDVPGVTTLDH
jgi:hypothetical protein